MKLEWTFQWRPFQKITGKHKHMLISSPLEPCWRGNATMEELSKQSTGFLVLLLFLSLGHRPEQHSSIHNKYSSLVSAGKRKNIGSSQTSWLTWCALTPRALCVGREAADFSPLVSSVSVTCPCTAAAPHRAEAQQSTPVWVCPPYLWCVWAEMLLLIRFWRQSFHHKSGCVCRANRDQRGREHTACKYDIHPKSGKGLVNYIFTNTCSNF